ADDLEDPPAVLDDDGAALLERLERERRVLEVDELEVRRAEERARERPALRRLAEAGERLGALVQEEGAEVRLDLLEELDPRRDERVVHGRVRAARVGERLEPLGER